MLSFSLVHPYFYSKLSPFRLIPPLLSPVGAAVLAIYSLGLSFLFLVLVDVVPTHQSCPLALKSQTKAILQLTRRYFSQKNLQLNSEFTIYVTLL